MFTGSLLSSHLVFALDEQIQNILSDLVVVLIYELVNLRVSKPKTNQDDRMCWFVAAQLQSDRSHTGAAYLVGDPASKVLNGELREGHLWPLVQGAVAVMIVTLLEESVVCCLAMKQQSNVTSNLCVFRVCESVIRCRTWPT